MPEQTRATRRGGREHDRSLLLRAATVVAGAGRRLFEPDDPTTRLELRRSEITSAGNAVLTYARRDGG